MSMTHKRSQGLTVSNARDRRLLFTCAVCLSTAFGRCTAVAVVHNLQTMPPYGCKSLIVQSWTCCAYLNVLTRMRNVLAANGCEWTGTQPEVHEAHRKLRNEQVKHGEPLSSKLHNAQRLIRFGMHVLPHVALTEAQQHNCPAAPVSASIAKQQFHCSAPAGVKVCTLSCRSATSDPAESVAAWLDMHTQLAHCSPKPQPWLCRALQWVEEDFQHPGAQCHGSTAHQRLAYSPLSTGLAGGCQAAAVQALQ